MIPSMRKKVGQWSDIAGHEVTQPHVISWISKGSFAILDQGLFAGANFLANILLANWIEPVQYGAFAVAYAVFLLLASFHTASLIEPMLIFGPGKYADCFPKYLGLLIYGHWSVTGVMTLIFALTALASWQWGANDLAQVFGGLAIAAPLILLQWLMRRAFYVHHQPQWSAAGGMLYLTLMVAGMYVLHYERLLSAALAVVIMGLASLAVSLCFSIFLKFDWHFSGEQYTPRTVLGDHWQYGRWASATAVLMWVPGNLYFTLLPLSIGMEGSAALRAVMNLVMPILHTNAAIAVFLLPYFVTAFRHRGAPGMHRLMRRSMILFGVGSLVYWGGVILFRHQLVTLLYRGHYKEYVDLLILVGVLPLFSGTLTVFGSALRAAERPDGIFWCYVVSTLVTATLGLWLLTVKGVTGAIAGYVTSSLAAAVIMIMIWRHVSQTLQDGYKHV